MKTRITTNLFLPVVFTLIGLFCGWYAAAHTGPESSYAHDHSQDAQQHDPNNLQFSPQTLANMGVQTTKARLANFNRSQTISAVIKATPAYRQEVFSPAAGRIKKINAAFGAIVNPGQVLITLTRKPLPRATLFLTEEVLKPVSESLHALMAELQRAYINLEILDLEKKRLKSFTGKEGDLPLLPGKQLIQLEYDLIKTLGEINVVKHKLRNHGLNKAQITGISQGDIPPVDAGIWLGALKHNGLWPARAAAIYAELPPKIQNIPWTVATIGELVAGNFASTRLQEWLKQDPAIGAHFLAIGGLLQKGHSLAEIKELHALKALEEIVQILAPTGAADWDVQNIIVKPGATVSAGQPLLVLENPHCLYLCGEPADGEIALCRKALERNAMVKAEAMVKGAGPDLTGLPLRRLFTLPETGRTVLFVPLTNNPMTTRTDPKTKQKYRTWDLRRGLHYQLDIPTKEYKKVYIFPTDAVVDDGPDKILFIQSGTSFRKVQVNVLFQDHRNVVVPGTTDIFPGNPVVTKGTFALKLAYAENVNAAGGCSSAGHSH